MPPLFNENMHRYIRIFLMPLLLLSGMTMLSAEGEKASFSLRDETGKTYTQEEFKGKELILFVFTFECPHCRRAMPVIQNMYKEGVPVFGVAYSTRYQDLDNKRKKAELTFPIAIGTKEFQGAYTIRGVPALILVAPDGTIRERFSGSKGAQRLQEVLGKKE